MTNRVIEPELDVHTQLEQALARIAELEKELFILKGKSNAVYFLPSTTSDTTATFTITGLSVGDTVTTGTYAGIVRSTEVPAFFRNNKP